MLCPGGSVDQWVAYLPHFEEEQDPDPHPHQREKSDPDMDHPSEKSDPDHPLGSKRAIRIRIDLMRIRNTAENETEWKELGLIPPWVVCREGFL